MGIPEVFQTHLASGHTTVARCWGIMRRDGQSFGFTDHDVDLSFDNMVFRADTGLSALSLAQSTGLSVDNTEALGALSHASVTEADIEAGRFDGAEVVAWLVNWANLAERTVQFRGTIGELRRAGGAFQAELRGLTEALNRPLGRIYQKPCTAVLGDRACRFAMDSAGYFSERPVETITDLRLLRFANMTDFEPGWFQRGTLRVLSGVGHGLSALIKRDRFVEDMREIELWEPLRAPLETGDMVRLDAGCDKRMETCRLKFANILNFQGFPDIPGDDWLMAHPAQDADADGGSLRQ